jgi:hypothetical protein
MSDFLAAVCFVEEKNVAAATPNVRAYTSQCHGRRNQLFAQKSVCFIPNKAAIRQEKEKKTYLPVTVQLQILIWLEHTARLSQPLEILLGRRGFDALSHIA